MNQYKLSLSFVLLSIIVLASSAETPYKKIIHNTDPEAKCLDGSSPAIYVHEGGDSDKFLIFFMGGGYCEGKTLGQVLDSCFDRSQGENGSSNPWPDQFPSQGGYLSTDPNVSRFATWTKFIILYCDGAHHQGYNQFPVSFRGVSLYFRGQKNVKSHLKWISNTYNFQQAQKVVLTGASAGGIATFLWSNYVRSLLTNPEAFYAIADSGVFMNTTSTISGQYQFSETIFQLFRISNTDALTPITTCNQKFSGQEHLCLFAENSFSSIEGKMLLINSEYDEVAIQEGLGIDCLQKTPYGKTLKNCSTQQLQSIEEYRTQYLSFLKNFMQFPKNSVWSVSCCAHSYACYQARYDSEAIRVPAVEGITVKEGVQSFVFEDERISSVDQVSWPDNEPCAF